MLGRRGARRKGPFITFSKWAILLVCLLVFGPLQQALAQTSEPQDVSAEPEAEESRQRLVVMPFEFASGAMGQTAYCPVCGAFFRIGRIEPQSDKVLTDLVFSYLQDHTRYVLIPPGQARGVMAQFMNENLGASEIEVIQAVGRRLSAEAVLTGIIFRWRERVGTSYAAQEPASVGFELHLVRVSDGALLWRHRVDKTQRPLTDNLLDIGTFFRSGAKWLTAYELSVLEFKTAFRSFPALISERQKPEGGEELR